MGSAKTNSEERRRLRRRLEALGMSSDEVERQVERLAEAQRNGGTYHPARLTAHSRKQSKSEGARRRRALARRDGAVCRYCGVALNVELAGTHVPSPPRATVDHVLPRSAGGWNSLDNLVLCCEPCNQAKGGVHRPGGFVAPGTPSKPTRVLQEARSAVYAGAHDATRAQVGQNLRPVFPVGDTDEKENRDA